MIFIIFLLTLLILLIFKNKEKFSLPSSHHIYMNYRTLVDNTSVKPTNTFYFPGKISDNCFTDVYNRCYGNKTSCQNFALKKCEGPSMISSRI